MVRVDVEGGGYDSASEALVGGNQLAALYHQGLTGELGGYGAMAGDDSTSQEFAAEYDTAAQEAVDGLGDLVDSFAALAELTAASIDNHRRANGSSVYGTPPVYDGSGSLGDAPVDVGYSSVPDSLGGVDEGTPDFWDEIVAHLEGFAWPNADVDRLRQAATTWGDAAGDVGRLADYCDTAEGQLSGQTSPEIPLALDAIGDLRGLCGDLADAFTSLGQACTEYADQVEEHREVIKGIVADMALEAGISMAAGAVVGFFSFGAGAAGGAAIAGWRITSAARKILSALQKLKALAKAGAVAKLTSAATKVKGLRDKLRKFKEARSLRKASKSTDPPPTPKPPRKPGDPLPESERPPTAGDDWEGRVANNGKGEVWQKPGSTGDADQIRIGEPDARYPDGYVRFYNENGQAIGLDGRTGIPNGTRAQNNQHTHIPIRPDGTYDVPEGWSP